MTTVLRNPALAGAGKELKVWMSRFKKTSRLALQDDPQLLEGLGIFVPSRKV